MTLHQIRKALNGLPGVGWVAFFHEIGDEGVNLVLLETDAKGELVVCGCGAFVLPSTRNFGPRVFLDNIVPPSEERLCESKMRRKRSFVVMREVDRKSTSLKDER